jgi:bifunctional non-homologous end joining protein LigD
MTEPRSASLFFTEGSSDKVYNAQLEERADGWAVAFQYGKRGKALQAGEKGTGLSFEKAAKIYDKLVGEKIAKGYTEASSGVAFSSAALAGRVTGFRPQLLNEISPEEAMLLGDDWLVQQKHDGERRGLLFEAETSVFSNRRGLEVGVQAPIAEAFRRLGEVVGGPLEVDGEDMGGHVVIFDVIQHFMLQDGTFRERAAILAHLEKTIRDIGLGDVLHVDVPVPAGRFFAEHAAELERSGAEGYVARRASSLYAPGRPASGGDALKVKFWAEATCRVAPGRDGKRSVAIELQDGVEGPWVAVGNVTVPANQAIPEVGALVEVRYLYAHEGGSLFQPTLKGPRTDVGPEAAQMMQLKFKAAEPRLEAVADDDGPSL